MVPLVTIRKVWASDLPYLKLLFSEDAMALPSKKELMRGSVAVNESGEPVGFIRVLQVKNEKDPRKNGNYVYPIIVFQNWQGYGVGRVLIEESYKKYGELKLVACRASRDFYPKCGFVPLSWDEVATRVADDCEHCADLAACEPKAFILPEGSLAISDAHTA